MSAAYDHLVKLLMVGDAAVGKSSLTRRYVEETFTEHTVGTIGVECHVQLKEINGRPVKFQFWDTAGQEHFRAIPTAYYRGARGVYITFDLTSQKSFDNVADWIKRTDSHFDQPISKVLIGNKADLVDQRVVSTSIAQSYADGLGLPYFETSALDGTNVQHAFLHLAASTAEAAQLEPKPFRDFPEPNEDGICW